MIGVRRINLLAVEVIDAPFVARGDLVRRGSIRRKVAVRLLAVRVADLQARRFGAATAPGLPYQ